MATKDIKSTYKTIMEDHFPQSMEISFVENNKRQTLVYEKATWIVDNIEKGL